MTFRPGEVCCCHKQLVVACRMPPKKKRIQPEILSPLLQKPEDTCVGNIENKDGAACGVERKLVHSRGRAGGEAGQGVYELS